MHGVSYAAMVVKCATAPWHHQVLSAMLRRDNVPVCLGLLDRCAKSVSMATGITDLPDAPVCFNFDVLFLISVFSEWKSDFLNG